jgi:hypothetical protein
MLIESLFIDVKGLISGISTSLELLLCITVPHSHYVVIID